MMPDQDHKTRQLRRLGTLNPKPLKVHEARFLQESFFDPRDIVQVKYEMLRSVHVDGHSVTAAAELFGFSRNAFYEARRAFRLQGIAGLSPKKRGPKGGHKITPDVLSELRRCLEADPSLNSGQLVEIARRDLGISLHPRTVERALEKGKKNS